MGAPKQKWNQEEEAALKAGVRKHGAGKWRTILKDPDFSGILFLRSNVDLKDKWRNMSVMASGWGSREKARLALKRMKPISKKDDNSLALTTVASDENNIDNKPLAVSTSSSQIGVLKKSVIRLDNLIMEAINTLKEPAGSSKTTIGSYIEDKYWSPPNFERLLSAKLKFLTSSGKLIKMRRKYRPASSAESSNKKPLSKLPVEARPPKAFSIFDDKYKHRLLTKEEINLELAYMRNLTPEEVAIEAAQAVAVAEFAMAEAVEAQREADDAEEAAKAAHAFAEAAIRALKERKGLPTTKEEVEDEGFEGVNVNNQKPGEFKANF